jgi:hypothetical protein
VHITQGDKLDAQARGELAEEERRHNDSLRQIIAGDSSRFIHEFQRHMDRVHEIMWALVDRRSPGPAG